MRMSRQRSLGPDTKELQTPSVECKLFCKQQTAGGDFSGRTVTELILLFWNASLKWVFFSTLRQVGNKPDWGAIRSRPYWGFCHGLCLTS